MDVTTYMEPFLTVCEKELNRLKKLLAQNPETNKVIAANVWEKRFRRDPPHDDKRASQVVKEWLDDPEPGIDYYHAMAVKEFVQFCGNSPAKTDRYLNFFGDKVIEILAGIALDENTWEEIEAVKEEVKPLFEYWEKAAEILKIVNDELEYEIDSDEYKAFMESLDDDNPEQIRDVVTEADLKSLDD